MVYYFYRALGLQLGKKTPKRRVKPSCVTTMRKPLGRTMSGPLNDPDQKTVRGTGFPANAHDQLALGIKLRILTIADTHSRYCLATDVRFQHRGEDVVQTLERIYGKVTIIRLRSLSET